MTQIKDFGHLGNDFQIKVISQIICDRTFGLNIIDIIKPNYFDNEHFRQIVSVIKDYNEKFENSLPTLSGLKEAIVAGNKDAVRTEYLVEIINDLEIKSLDDDKATQKLALNFCKQQETKKAMKKVNSIIERGDFDNYDENIGEILRQLVTVGNRHDDTVEVLDDIDSCLEEDYRKPIPTGIHGIDEKIGGGLGKGELAIFLAPTGVGKSTFLTKVANTAYNRGHNVLQVFFEDNVKDIRRKHLTLWSKIGLQELSKPEHNAHIKEAAKNAKLGGGRLFLKKCPSDSTTLNHIKQYIRFLANKGIKIDMIVLDYIDCIAPSKAVEDQNANEGTTIRQFETMISEFDIVGWTAIQSGRAGIAADVVTLDQMGGSIKRAQVGHLVLSCAKTLQQKEAGLATMAILKSRFGGDGEIFKDMTFKNSTLEFDTTENNVISQMGYETLKAEQKEKLGHNKAAAALAMMNQRNGIKPI